MQLLEDSVFYNLLLNNQESLIDSRASSVPLEAKEPVHALEYPQSLDYSQMQLPHLNAPSQHVALPPLQPQGLHYPIPDYRFSLPQHDTSLHTQLQPPPLSDVPSSYQHSIFSESTSPIENDTTQEQIQQNDFLMKDTLLQIKSEAVKPTIPSSSSNGFDMPQKRFHRFYSTTMTPSDGRVQKKTQAPSYHKCPFCQRQFKNKSYLSRHMKKHDVVKDYKCPFFSSEHTKCHPLNGEFSRKDTFKAHLKSIHFIYPIGISKVNRNDSGGRCAGCFKEFASNNDWISEHIEGEKCPGFAKFKGV